MPQSIPYRIENKSRRLARFSLASAIALALAGMSGNAMAQAVGDAVDGGAKEVENSKFATTGIILSNAVFVRCGPGDNYYPTMKLDKGAKVKVVGAKFDWLKITPPEGSFCYVAKLYVDRHGDGKVGRVNKDSINVRAGSSLSALKIGILCELRQNEEVEILGDEQEYFKIKPPAAAFLYINKKFVEPDPEAKPEVQVAGATSATPEAPRPAAPEVPAVAGNTGTPPAGIPAVGAPEVKPETPVAGNTGSPAGTPAPEVAAPAPAAPDTTAAGTPTPVPAPEAGATTLPPAAPMIATTPAPRPETIIPVQPPAAPELSPEAAYEAAEAQFEAARALPLEKQPINELVSKYETLAKGNQLPESMRRIAESRLATLQGKSIAQADLIKLRKSQDDLRQRQMALEAEQEELKKRISDNAVKFYAAVGTLQPSSLQQGAGMLYRITDPATGRTICYLRSNDKNIVNMLGQFVGVKGNVVDDARLGGRVIMASEMVAADPQQMHQSITAQIIPPSLMPKEPAQAATDQR